MNTARRAALAALSVVIALTSLTAFAESYRALMAWASMHGLHGIWAAVFPAQIDTFVLVGELALFVALADRWAPRSRLFAWAVTLAGLAVSVAANVGHVAGHALTSRATAAVPPVAAAAALAVGLGVLKRVSGATVEQPEAEPGAVPAAPGPVLASGPVERHARRTAPADDFALEAKALELLTGDLTMSGAELARKLDVSESYGRKLRRRLTQPGPLTDRDESAAPLPRQA